MAASSDTSLDPYAYLEDAAGPATRAWTDEQNARTRAALDALPERAALAKRFDALLDIDTLEAPVASGGRLFYVARRSGAEQAVLYGRWGKDERVLIDPAALDASGLTALDWWYPSPQGRLVAFGLSRGGDERSTLHVIDVATKTRLGEAIPDTRHCSLAWSADESGFFYTRYPAGESYDVRLFYHALETPWARDDRIFGDGRRPEEFLVVRLSADGRHLVVSVFDGWTRSDAYVADTTAASLHFVPLVEGRDALFDVLAGNRALIVRSNEGAARFRLFGVAYDQLARAAWREIVPETVATLEGVALARDTLVLHYVQDARSSVRIRHADGSGATLAAVRGRGVTGISATESSREAFVAYESFVEPPVVLRVALDATPARVFALGAGGATVRAVRVSHDARVVRLARRHARSADVDRASRRSARRTCSRGVVRLWRFQRLVVAELHADVGTVARCRRSLRDRKPARRRRVRRRVASRRNARAQTKRVRRCDRGGRISWYERARGPGAPRAHGRQQWWSPRRGSCDAAPRPRARDCVSRPAHRHVALP